MFLVSLNPYFHMNSSFIWPFVLLDMNVNTIVGKRFLASVASIVASRLASLFYSSKNFLSLWSAKFFLAKSSQQSSFYSALINCKPGWIKRCVFNSVGLWIKLFHVNAPSGLMKFIEIEWRLWKQFRRSSSRWAAELRRKTTFLDLYHVWRK